MAKREGKNTDKPLSEGDRPVKPQRGFWASLFEPVAQDPDADYLFDELLDDGEPDEGEAEAASQSDAAPVAPERPAAEETRADMFPDAGGAEPDDPYAILSASFAESEAFPGSEAAPEAPEAAGVPLTPEDAEAIAAAIDETLAETPGTIELTAESVVVEEPEAPAYASQGYYAAPAPEAPAFASETPAPAVAPEGYVPLVSAVDAGMQMAPYAPAEQEAPAPETTAPAVYVPLVSAIDAAANVQPVPYAQETRPVPYAPPASGVPQAEWFDYASGVFRRGADEAARDGAAPINLFEDDGLTDTGRQRAQTTRLFRTGTSATTRIHINETEEAVRREEAARKAEAREAKRREAAEAARTSKRKKRGSVLRGLFANIAFVLFFIAVVVVALYYGFLLSDIVVMGNDKYTKEYIVEQSGLTLGTHMLFCDLTAAGEKISEDPYLQVDSITYIFPNRVRIIITERQEVAGITGLDYNVIIDDQGYVLSMSPSTDLSGLLQVSGVSMTGFRLGQRLGEGNDFSTATLIELIGKLEQYELMDDITSVDLTTPLAITMKAKTGLTIHVGQGTDLDSKMSMLARLLPRFYEQSIGTGTLYLSAKGGAVYSPSYAAGNAVPVATGDADTANLPADIPSTFVDDDGDGLDDVTGLPEGQAALPATTDIPLATPAPTAYVPGGGADDFSG